MTYKCGDKPGIGHYECTSCSETIFLNDATDTLPPCPKCKTNCTYNKV